MKILDEIDKIVIEYFYGNRVMAAKWYAAKNPSLGEISPNDMINSDRAGRLLEMITILREPE